MFLLMERNWLLFQEEKLFVSDIEGKFIQQLNSGNAERVREVKWLSDNKTILFNQTTGWLLQLVYNKSR